jgi:hypothetical protein
MNRLVCGIADLNFSDASLSRAKLTTFRFPLITGRSFVKRKVFSRIHRYNVKDRKTMPKTASPEEPGLLIKQQRRCSKGCVVLVLTVSTGKKI